MAVAEKDKKSKDKNKVLTPVFRVSYPSVFKATAVEEGKEPKFSIQMLFREKPVAGMPEYEKEFVADLLPMKQAAAAVLVEEFGPKSLGKWPTNMRKVFRPGPEKDHDEGIVFCSASSKFKPGLLNEKKEDIIEPEEFYAGCYARAIVVPYYYDVKGNRGIAWGLRHVMKWRDGEPFGGGTKATEEFSDIEPPTPPVVEEGESTAGAGANSADPLAGAAAEL